MPQEIKQLGGLMDLDSTLENMSKVAHRNARNIIFRGSFPNMRAESIPGTTRVSNSLLPNSGFNLSIGSHYDPVLKRIFAFNYNSNGFHGIYIYYTITKVWIRLIEVGVNTSGDPLGFTLNGRINGIDILYGDANDGDLLFFIDSLKRPTKININRYSSGIYSGIKRSFIEVIKAPPIVPPKCCYENDYTVQSNNLINSLFQFCESFIYDDNEESVVSSASKVPLPLNTFDPKKNISKNLDSRISIYIQTGDATVKKIRIYGRQTKSGSTSDWFIIDTLNKSDLGIPNNTVYKYWFYNTGNYVSADPKFTVLLQDYVPQQANCQSLLNGTTISYAGIVEGYNYIKSLINITQSTQLYQYWDIKGSSFFASYNGSQTGPYNNLTIYLTGAGTNDGDGNPISLTYPPYNFYVNAMSISSDVSFSYTGNTLTSIPAILNTIKANAISAGWVFVGSNTNSITIYYPDVNVVLNSAFSNGLFSPIVDAYTPPVFSHYPTSAYSYGVVYYDAYGRTNGVITNVSANITIADITPGIGLSTTSVIPNIVVDLSQYNPPSWAYYYHIVRTDNLTFSKHLNWVSKAAYSSTDPSTNNKYAYIDITNINDYNANQNATNGVVSYGFSEGDRIRFMGVYAVDGTITNLSFDYAIVGVAINPNINGTIQIGTFIQIFYPTNDITSTFKFDGTPNAMNYNILLYNFKPVQSSKNNVYYEIGEQYGIFNPGTINATHMGNISLNHVCISSGDCFFRTRIVPSGQTYYIPYGSYNQGGTYSTFQCGLASPIVNSLYEIRGGNHLDASLTTSGILDYPKYSDNSEDFFNKSFSTISIRLRPTSPIQIYDFNVTNGTFGIYLKLIDSSNNPTILTVQAPITGIGIGTDNTKFINFDTIISVPPGVKVWFIGYAIQIVVVSGFTLRLDIVNNITINCFDPSYSDIYALQTNSDNRPNLVDSTALQTYFSTLFRWGQPYQLGTNINNSNRFYPNNFDEWDKSFGSVIRMRIRDRELRVFQERRCGHTGIYAKYISDNSGTKTLITTDSIITQNNIEYYAGEFGIGNQGDSLISSGYSDYFVDPIKGYPCRLSLDGVKPIALEFHTQSFWGPLLPKFLKNYTNVSTNQNAVILGVFNFLPDRDSEAIFVIQGGVNNGDTIQGQSFSFNEAKNAWTSFYDFSPESIICAENVLYSFVQGDLYSHTNTNTYSNFYSVQFYPEITLVFNDKEVIKKTFDYLMYQSNKVWASPNIGDISTSQINEQTLLPQISRMQPADFQLQEWQKTGAFLKDANSNSLPLVGLWEGDYLKGSWISVRMTYQGSDFTYLYGPIISYSLSPKNF